MSTIFFLVKFFSEASYAEDFLNGRMWINPLSYFKALESLDYSGRADRHEGTVAWLQPGGQERLLIGEMDVTDRLVGPIQIQQDWLNYIYIYCLHAIHSGNYNLEEITDENIGDLTSELKVPNACLALGEYSVLIQNVPEFVRRLESVVYAKKYGFARGLVRYYDPDSFHGQFDDVESIFWKQDKFKDHREYRFAIDSGLESDSPLILDIGNIKDIATMLKTTELNGPRFLGGETKVTRY